MIAPLVPIVHGPGSACTPFSARRVKEPILAKSKTNAMTSFLPGWQGPPKRLLYPGNLSITHWKDSSHALERKIRPGIGRRSFERCRQPGTGLAHGIVPASAGPGCRPVRKNCSHFEPGRGCPGSGSAQDRWRDLARHGSFLRSPAGRERASRSTRPHAADQGQHPAESDFREGRRKAALQYRRLVGR
jgi:hypothetical protein